MATLNEIRTVERLMQTLDDNPPLLEALRTRVLTRELLEMPANHAKLTARVDQLVDSVQKMRDGATAFEERVALRFNRIDNDLTWLKDVGATTVAEKQAMFIAEDLGLEYEKQLTQHEVRDLVRNQDTSGIAPGDLRSFRNADMIIEATDAAGQLNYIAVEVSFTADQRDTDRPIRNAGYLTRFTGQPAHAVVASVRTDNRIHDIIESGQIYWHRLYAKSVPRE